MRLAIRGAFTLFFIAILTAVILDVSSHGIRSTETATIANDATYEAIHVLSNGTYEIENVDQLVAEAIKEVVLDKESNSDIKIQILGIDAENGMIDMNVIQTIHHVNGKTTTEQQRRTVIIETKSPTTN